MALCAVFLGCCAGLRAAENSPWLSKDPAEWTLEDAEAVLWLSPWVKFKTLSFFDPRRAVREAKFYVRIHSARPIRLALAEAYSMQPDGHVHRIDRVPAEEIEVLAGKIEFPGEIVFSLIAFPPSFHRRLNEQDPEVLLKTVHLQIGTTPIGICFLRGGGIAGPNGCVKALQ